MHINLTRTHRLIALIGISCIALVLAIMLVLTLLKHASTATTGAIHITPTHLDAASGTTMEFRVSITPATKVDTVMATVSYDPATMTYKGISYKDSPFTSQIPATTSKNSLTMQSALLGGNTVERDAPIATLTFVATKSGMHDVRLTDGNAALAGVATNPILTDITGSHESPSSKAATLPATGSEAVVPSQALPAPLAPVAALLRSVGMTDAAAMRSAPWIGGVILCLLLAIVGIIGIVLYKKRRGRTGPGQESTQV